MKKILSIVLTIAIALTLFPGFSAEASAFNSKTALKNIDSSVFTLGKACVISAKNNNDYPVSYNVTIKYYNDNGKYIGKSTGWNPYFEKHRKFIMALAAPMDKDGEELRYTSYKVSYKVSKPKNMTSNVKDIKTELQAKDDGIELTATNSGSKRASSTQIAVVYYKNNAIIGVIDKYPNIKNPGDNDTIEYGFLKDYSGNIIVPDDYTVNVNYSIESK